MKLAALFWSDLQGPRLKEIVARIAAGYRVLALDVKVLLFCVQNDIPHALIEDWLDRETLYRCAVLAHHLEKTWFQGYEDLFTVDGLCFPELDSEAMYHFWREVVAASVFMEVFLAKGGKDVYVPHDGKVPSVFYYRADSWKRVVALYVNGAGTPGNMRARVNTFAGDLHMTDSIFGDGRFARLAPMDGCDPRPRAGRPRSEAKVAFALNPSEIRRFEPALRTMNRQRWARTVIYLASGDRRVSDDLANRWDLPILPLPAIRSEAGRLSEILYSAFEQARKANPGKLGPAIALDHHFRYYCDRRWPHLFAVFGAWKRLWEHERPSAVVASSLADAESQLPVVAANRFGIETFSMPHARFMGIRDTQQSRHILYDFIPYRDSLEKIGIAPERLAGCRNMLGKRPYPTHRPLCIEKKRLNILAFVGNVNGTEQDGELFFPRVLSSAQIEAIRSSANPPEELKTSVQIRYKVHPKGAEMEMFELGGVDIDKSLLPHDTETLEALEFFDLVIDMNNTGSAVLNAIEKEKPLLLWWNGLIKRADYNVEVLLAAGEPVSNGEALWNAVSRFIHDDDYRRALIDRVKDFKDRYMDSGRYPELGRVIRRRLTNDDAVDEGAPGVSDPLERIAGSPGDLEALMALARRESDGGRPAEALAFLQDVLILDPAHREALALRERIGKGRPDR